MIKKIKTWSVVIKNFITSITVVSRAQFYSDHDLVSIAIKNRKSIIRYGDGEFSILNGKDIYYQDYSEQLKAELNEISCSYLNDSKCCNYILCMPKQFLVCSGLDLLKNKEYIGSWSLTRKIFKKQYDKSITYGDSFLFMAENIDCYNELWKDAKTIIFVHNNDKYMKNFHNRHVEYIKVPPNNAYSCKDSILSDIKDIITDKDNTVILISAEPTAKCIAYDLSSNGYWVIDTGHCWDTPLKKRI
ncbi:GT-D fold domain-containing glycosyltransferase [Vibrio parahaemolyticus]